MTILTTILIIIALIVLFVSAILERYSIATVLIIVSGIYYHFWCDSIVTLISENYQVMVPIAVGYIVLGVVWSFAKWVMFLLEFKRFRNKHIEAYREDKLLYDQKRFHNVLITDTPKTSDFKVLIISWMCWWPLSVIGTLINDPVKRAFQFVFDALSGSYQKIADKIVPKIS